MTTKDQLAERKHGKGGSIVRLTQDIVVGGITFAAGTTFVVKDLYQRARWNKPGRIAIGPVDRGIAWGVSLDEIEVA